MSELTMIQARFQLIKNLEDVYRRLSDYEKLRMVTVEPLEQRKYDLKIKKLKNRIKQLETYLKDEALTQEIAIAILSPDKINGKRPQSFEEFAIQLIEAEEQHLFSIDPDEKELLFQRVEKLKEDIELLHPTNEDFLSLQKIYIKLIEEVNQLLETYKLQTDLVHDPREKERNKMTVERIKLLKEDYNNYYSSIANNLQKNKIDQ